MSVWYLNTNENNKSKGLKMKFCKLLIAAALIIYVASFSAKVKAEPSVTVYDGWQYEFEPYIFLSTIEGNAKIGLAPHSELYLDFGTIFDNLNMAGMFHFEAHHSTGWGLAIDYGFMDLGQDKANQTGGISEVGLRQGVLEALALYRVKYGLNSLDYFTGIRWWDNDLSLSFSTNNNPSLIDIDKREDWVDFVVGVRWIMPLSKNWSLVSRADIGGFGLTSDFTSTVELGATYQISDSVILNMKYKSAWVDYDNEEEGRDAFIYDTATHGPVIGLRVAF